MSDAARRHVTHGRPDVGVRAGGAAELADVSVRFPRRALPVLAGVCVHIGAGEHVLLLGASGSGKSTVLQVLTGVVPHTVAADLSGRVSVSGTPTTESSVVELSRHVGVLAQDPASAVCLPEVEQELALPLENRAVDPGIIGARVERALQAVGAGPLRSQRTAELSGGETQRVALAAALVTEPAVLLLDEPTSMLDPAGVAAVRRAITSATAEYGPAVVLVEHRLDELAGEEGVPGLPARTVVLGGSGAVLADGPTAEVLAEHAGALHSAGCWLPLEAELQAVTGEAGGLSSATNRAFLAALAHPADGATTAPRPHDGAASPQDLAAPGRRGRPVPAGVAPPGTRQPVLTTRDLAVARPGHGRAGGRRRGGRTPRRRDRAARGVTAPLLTGVRLELRAGEVVALLGANGVGKTSLLLTLAGLAPAAAGTVRGPRPGMVFQNAEHQFVAHTVREEIRHGLGTGPEADRAVERLLEEHRLAHLAGQNPFRLSGGEKRRLSLAAMLAHPRPVLLADEPTLGLDRRDTLATLAALRSAAAQGHAVVLSSHDLRTVATVADRAVVLAEGTVIADGPAVAVLRDTDVRARAQLTLPTLLAWLLERFSSGDAVRAVLTALDAQVVPAPAPPSTAGTPR